MTYHVEPAITLNAKGREVRDGWDVINSRTGEWAQRYRTKREAQEAVKAMESGK